MSGIFNHRLSVVKILTIDSDTLVVSDIGKYLSDVWSKLDDKSIAIAPEAMSKDGPGDSYYTDRQHVTYVLALVH